MFIRQNHQVCVFYVVFVASVVALNSWMVPVSAGSNCPLGWYGSEGSSSCTQCPGGTYSNYARTTCLPWRRLASWANINLYLDSNHASVYGQPHFWEFANNENQLWILDTTAGCINPPNDIRCGMMYTIQSIQNNLCYDFFGALLNGGRPNFYSCDPTSGYQKWAWTNNRGDKFQIRPYLITQGPALYIYLDSHSPRRNGDFVHLWLPLDIHDSYYSNQQWKEFQAGDL